jgi:hypothetical protein
MDSLVQGKFDKLDGRLDHALGRLNRLPGKALYGNPIEGGGSRFNADDGSILNAC